MKLSPFSMMTVTIAVFFITLSSYAITTPFTCKGTFTDPCVTLDTVHNPIEVKHWRPVEMVLGVFQGDMVGINKLHLSGSAVPSVAGWDTIKKEIQKLSHDPNVNITVIDLRQETHGYLDYDAATLAAAHNWINIGKSKSKVLEAELAWQQKTTSPLYVITAKQYKAKQFDLGFFLPFIKLRSEQEIVEAIGMKYIRFTVTDHMAPDPAEVDRFIQMVNTLPESDWLHIHCRGGEGRTVTFFAMYDMLLNAHEVNFDSIIKRQASIPPYYDLSDIEHGDPELAPFYKIRYRFLQVFYQYARARHQGDMRPWSEWQKEHHYNFSLQTATPK